jgi:hypothetical protein
LSTVASDATVSVAPSVRSSASSAARSTLAAEEVAARRRERAALLLAAIHAEVRLALATAGGKARAGGTPRCAARSVPSPAPRFTAIRASSLPAGDG